jgi:hypothetical protein
MGTGLHGSNGIDPRVAVKIYELYALPKLIYGLDVADINKTQLRKLEEFHRGMLRSLQSLPSRTANEAVYLLAGSMPVEGYIHLRMLSLIGAISRSGNTTLAEVANRQCALKGIDSQSWFKKVEILLLMYGLPSTGTLLKDPVSKVRWKEQVKKAVTQSWSAKLRQDIPSLYMLNLTHTAVGHVHHCWSNVMPCVKDVRRAAILVKLLTGCYPTQEKLARWDSTGKVSPACVVCGTAVETTEHVLLWCPATHGARAKEMCSLAELVCQGTSRESWSRISSNDTYLMFLLLDSSHLIDAGLLSDDEPLIESLATSARRLCYSVHCSRAHLMEEMKKMQKK